MSIPSLVVNSESSSSPISVHQPKPDPHRRHFHPQLGFLRKWTHLPSIRKEPLHPLGGPRVPPVVLDDRSDAQPFPGGYLSSRTADGQDQMDPGTGKGHSLVVASDCSIFTTRGGSIGSTVDPDLPVVDPPELSDDGSTPSQEGPGPCEVWGHIGPPNSIVKWIRQGRTSMKNICSHLSWRPPFVTGTFWSPGSFMAMRFIPNLGRPTWLDRGSVGEGVTPSSSPPTSNPIIQLSLMQPTSIDQTSSSVLCPTLCQSSATKLVLEQTGQALQDQMEPDPPVVDDRSTPPQGTGSTQQWMTDQLPLSMNRKHPVVQMYRGGSSPDPPVADHRSVLLQGGDRSTPPQDNQEAPSSTASILNWGLLKERNGPGGGSGSDPLLVDDRSVLLQGGDSSAPPQGSERSSSGSTGEVTSTILRFLNWAHMRSKLEAAYPPLVDHILFQESMFLKLFPTVVNLFLTAFKLVYSSQGGVVTLESLPPHLLKFTVFSLLFLWVGEHYKFIIPEIAASFMLLSKILVYASVMPLIINLLRDDEKSKLVAYTAFVTMGLALGITVVTMFTKDVREQEMIEDDGSAESYHIVIQVE